MTPERREAVLGWLEKAESDFAYARLGADAGEYYYSGAVYHCQQAAEKALKALCCQFGVVPPRSHDLLRLIEILEPFHSLRACADAAVFLTPMATEFRYPGDLQIPARDDLLAALEHAQEFLAIASAIIHDSGENFPET